MKVIFILATEYKPIMICMCISLPLDYSRMKEVINKALLDDLLSLSAPASLVDKPN